MICVESDPVTLRLKQAATLDLIFEGVLIDATLDEPVEVYPSFCQQINRLFIVLISLLVEPKVELPCADRLRKDPVGVCQRDP